MKLTQDNNVMLSNAPAPETHSFGVTDMRIIMEVLTKLYANPIQTITQEYISNARDAHRELKQTKRIEITAPTRFNAVMKIRDFGPGLSPDRIKNVFIFYGASTKRDTNSQTGGFGIGAKSAWSYTDSFVIVSYVDGVKRTYNAHKSKGTGNLDKIAEEPTNEPNGVSIEIAVQPQDVNRFRSAIFRTIFFWKQTEMPVVKGAEASEVPDIKPKFTDIANVHVYDALPNCFPHDYNSKSLIVVDGIPYPNRGYTQKLERKIKGKFVILLETGHVDIAPNREELINDDRTKCYLETIDAKAHRELEAHISSQLKNLTNIKNCVKVAAEIKKQFEGDISYKNYNFSYNGLYVIDPKPANNYNTHLHLGSYWNFYSKKYHKKDFNQIGYGELDNLYYDDMPNERNTKKVWRVKKTMEKNNHQDFKLLRHDLDAQIITDLGAKPLSSIDASDYKVQRQAKAAVKKLELCLHYFNGSNLLPTQENLTNVTDTVVYALLDSKVYDSRHSNKVINFVNSKTGMKFAFIAKGSEYKVSSLANFIAMETFTKSYKASDAEIKYYLRTKDYTCNTFERLDTLIPDLKDQSLKYMIELANFKPGNTISTCSLPEDMIDKTHKLMLEYDTHANEMKDLDKRYPLFNSFSYSNLNKKEYRDDVIIYLNAKYDDTTKKGISP